MKERGKIEYRIYKRRGELEKSARSGGSRRRRLPPPGDRHRRRRRGEQLGRKTRRAVRDEKRERDGYPFSRGGKERERRARRVLLRLLLLLLTTPRAAATPASPTLSSLPAPL